MRICNLKTNYFILKSLAYLNEDYFSIIIKFAKLQINTITCSAVEKTY